MGRETGGGFRRQGTFLYTCGWLDVWQKPTQYYKATILQFFKRGERRERETLNWRKSIWKSYSLLSPWAYPGCRWIVLNSNCPLESSDNFSKAWWRGPILRPIKSTSLEIGLLKLPDYFSVQPGLRVSAVSAEEFKFQSRNLGGGEWVDTLLASLSRKNRKGALIAL